MPNTKPTPRRTTRGRAPVPRRNFLRRNAPLIAPLVVLAVVVGLIVISRDTTKPSPSPATAASASATGFVGGDLHSLVADPTTPGRLFAGGHDAVALSADAGRTWSRVDPLDGADAMGWAFTPDAIYVTGHPGINRSTDRGTTFRQANAGLTSTDVHAFGGSANTLYAAGPGLGVTASTDGGSTWASRTQNAGQAFFGRILVDATDDQSLIAADARNGAAASTDGGRTWRRLGGPPSAVWVSRTGTTLYVSTGGPTAAMTSDGGATWTNLTLPTGASLVEADRTDPQLLYAGVHTGDNATVSVSHDGGRTWTGP